MKNPYRTPTNVDRVNQALKQLLDNCGLSPWVKGDSKKITALIKKTGLDIIYIKHFEDPVFHGKETLVHYAVYGEEACEGTEVFEYDWG